MRVEEHAVLYRRPRVRRVPREMDDSSLETPSIPGKGVFLSSSSSEEAESRPGVINQPSSSSRDEGVRECSPNPLETDSRPTEATTYRVDPEHASVVGPLRPDPEEKTLLLCGDILTKEELVKHVSGGSRLYRLANMGHFLTEF
ncbi:hypothetical protein AKJ16_DCAP12966 [Drosera capensis]